MDVVISHTTSSDQDPLREIPRKVLCGVDTRCGERLVGLSIAALGAC